MVNLIWKHFKLPALDRASLPDAPLGRWLDLADRYDQLREEVCLGDRLPFVLLLESYFSC